MYSRARFVTYRCPDMVDSRNIHIIFVCLGFSVHICFFGKFIWGFSKHLIHWQCGFGIYSLATG